jgi:hypothetical protein
MPKNMRNIKKANVELVYSAMKSHYEGNREWKKPLSFKEIEDSVDKLTLLKRLPKMNRRCIYRHIDTLMEKPPRVIKVGNGRGLYTIDFAREQIAKQREAFKKIMLSIDSHRELRGETTHVIHDQRVDVPTNPIFDAPETQKIYDRIEKWRLQIHGQKDIANAEAVAWISGFIEVLSYDIETGEYPLRIRPESLLTTDRKVGVNAFIFRKAMEIMLELLESLDLESLKKDKTPGFLGDTQLCVRITFNPAAFYQALKYYRDREEIRLNQKRVFIPGMPGKQYEYGEKLKKRVFNEAFADQPNSLVTEDTPIRFKKE